MNVKTLTAAILDKMPEINKWQRDFLIENFDLQCRMRGRHNFLNMSRYSDLNESTFRENYGRNFDFVAFNRQLIDQFCSKECGIAFDPSYISKSGKHTPGNGYFWSGCAGKKKWGIEIGGFAAIDIPNNTAMHITADQTLTADEYPSLLTYYRALVCLHSKQLKGISKYLIVDAYFSKEPFINKVCQTGLEVITRLRNDSVLFYPYAGPHPKRKGAKTKYLGRMNAKELDHAYFTCCVKEADFCIYEATLYSKALKRKINVAVKHNFDKKGAIKSYQIYCSTDLSLSGAEIYVLYKTRFQIEFLFRDAKQFVGLEHCQSRSESKLHFHFNTALTTVSLVKAIYHLTVPIDQRKSFSMADIKTQYFNEHMVDLIICECGINPHLPKIKAIRNKIIDFGKINLCRA